MKNNTILLIIGFIICVVLSCMLWYSQSPKEVIKTDTVFSTKTDTLWNDTTIVKKEYVPTIVEKIQIDTVYDSNGDTIQLIVEAKKWEDSIVSNKDTAYLEIFTTGIKTSLDSTKIRLKTHTEVITNTVEVTKIVQKKKTVWDKISIGLQGGYGYTFNSREFQPYIGVGIGINL